MKTRVVMALLVGLVAVPAAAAADGLPVTGLDAGVGVLAPDGSYRIVTFAESRHTVIARIRRNDGTVARSRTIPGRFSVPAVAYDNSGSGVSRDGRTLALIRTRTKIPEKTTSLVILDARRFTERRRIKLRGDFSFDAISPDGGRVYLVEYLSLARRNFDPTKYKVRSLDVRSGRLDPAPIVDPREPDEKMGGLPVTRLMSADGRWAYTLYTGGEHPFIHALDTVGRTARCVDLDQLTARQDLFQLRLRASGHSVYVMQGKKPLLQMDTTSFAVSRPRQAAAVHAAPPEPQAGDPIWPWFAAAGVLLLLLAAGARPLARAARSH